MMQGVFDTPEYQAMGLGTGKFVSKGWLLDQGRYGWEIQMHIYNSTPYTFRGKVTCTSLGKMNTRILELEIKRFKFKVL